MCICSCICVCVCISVCVCVFVFVFVQIHHFNQRLGVFLQAFGGVYFQRPINQTLPAVFGPPAAADHRRHDVKAKTKNKNKTELIQIEVTRPDQNGQVGGPKMVQQGPEKVI